MTGQGFDEGIKIHKQYHGFRHNQSMEFFNGSLNLGKLLFVNSRV